MLVFAFGALASAMFFMNQGNQIDTLMAFGQYWDARDLLTQKIRDMGSRADMHLYSQRALCHVNMKMYAEAIEDANRVLKSSARNDDKHQCYIVRANAYLMTGEFKKAESDAIAVKDNKLIRRAQEAARAERNLEKAQTIDQKIKYLDILLSMAPQYSKYILMRADLAWEQGDRDKFAELTNGIANDYPKDSTLHYRRALLFFCDGNLDEANKNLRKASGNKNASTTLKDVTNFNKLYQDANKFLNAKKPADAEIAINKSLKIAETHCPLNSQLVGAIGTLRIKLMKLKGLTDEVMDLLTTLIDQGSASADIYLERGDLNMERKDYDQALFDYQNAQSRDPRSRRAQEGINNAQAAKQKASRIDHYEILGVSETASKSEITQAYRKKVREWHPDRYSDKTKKKQAEEMMKKVNIAFEVLSDDQKRAMYDRGQNPDDPHGSGFGMDPFADFFGGGSPFDFFFNQGGGGGGQHFQFGGDGGHFEFHFQF